MIYYSTELVVDKPVAEILSLLPMYYYDGQPVLKGGAVSGYAYSCKTLLFTVHTAITVQAVSGHACITLASTAREHRWLFGFVLYAMKPFLQLRQLSDLRYLKQRIEKG